MPALLLCHGLVRCSDEVLMAERVHELAKSSERATIFSIKGMLLRGLAAIGFVPIGQLADAGGVQSAFLFIGVANLVCLLGLGWQVKRRNRRIAV